MKVYNNVWINNRDLENNLKCAIKNSILIKMRSSNLKNK